MNYDNVHINENMARDRYNNVKNPNRLKRESEYKDDQNDSLIFKERLDNSSEEVFLIKKKIEFFF